MPRFSNEIRLPGLPKDCRKVVERHSTSSQRVDRSLRGLGSRATLVVTCPMGIIDQEVSGYGKNPKEAQAKALASARRLTCFDCPLKS